ncbi:hypothetical protein [Breoghania sp.]|uniref:hypothetical protein n=1 Tax=Breoghania sp. TaxID=2065378 RepID=UPI0026134B83|nr:hypothetical protein [Breoghania sp.]MDJ0933128.1 hypothetical protein [Breoghania sp.]
MGWIEESAKVVDALGTEDFAKILTDALRMVVPFEYTVVFAYYLELKPLDLYDDFSKVKRRVMIDDYHERPYLLDPLYLHSTPLVGPRLTRLRELAPDRFYQSEYFRNYYVQTGLAEEIGFMVEVGDDVTVVVSAMRPCGSTRSFPFGSFASRPERALPFRRCVRPSALEGFDLEIRGPTCC